jgi:hypothetical protein
MESSVDLMPSQAAFVVGSASGLFGALAAAAVGARHTKNRLIWGGGGVVAGAAFAALCTVLWNWLTRGFALAELWVPLLAALILLLVMAAQNWFVVYEDRDDAWRSSRPALVMLAAAAAALLIGRRAPTMLPFIWAGAGSLVLMLCADPVQRAIERTRNVPLGTLIGIAKFLLPLSGVVLFLRVSGKPQGGRSQTLLVNLAGLCADVGSLALVTLINGARVPAPPPPADPLELLMQPRDGQAAGGDMPRVKRDSLVMIMVLAVHVLCGVVIVRA